MRNIARKKISENHEKLQKFAKTAKHHKNSTICEVLKNKMWKHSKNSQLPRNIARIRDNFCKKLQKHRKSLRNPQTLAKMAKTAKISVNREHRVCIVYCHPYPLMYKYIDILTKTVITRPLKIPHTHWKWPIK